MSFGKTSSSGQQQSQSTSFYDPTQTALVDQNAANVQAAGTSGALAYTPYSGQPLSFGSSAPLDALTTYQAPAVTASTYAPTGYSSTGYTASTIDPSSVADVKAGQLASTDLSPYLDPYTADVINTTAGQLARQNNIDNATAAGQATAAGAFGGSRSAVLQNLNTDSYDRSLASTVASLNQANYAQAQQGALTDIGNRLTADTTNQGKALTIGGANQTATNAAAAFGATAANEAGQFGATAANQAGQFNAGQTQSAATGNQQASLASAQTQLSALGINESQAEALFGANWQEYLNSQTDPLAVQQAITQAYGIIPTGALSQSTSSGTTSSSGLNFGLPTGSKIPGLS